MPRKAAATQPPIPPTAQPTMPIVEAGGLSSLTASPEIPVAERAAALAIIQNEVAGCVRCDALASTRTQTVFGVGDPAARLCFVGEAPGADEDARGEPFVGRAGQLLTKIIEACRLTREQVYIANVLKCRPPNNRPPEPAEVVNCRGYLDRQLEIVRPETIVCLGATAAKCLLQTEVSIGKLRGRWHDYRGIAVYCTYHPAYLLRNPNAKKDVWEDMKVVMKRLGVSL
ncbi:MAG: uracil-DNA glycosylase [Pirellulales bacterium]